MEARFSAEEKFEVGDLVKLKSGGPDMTVIDSYEDGTIGCVWFDKAGRVHDKLFLKITLKKVS